MKHLSGIQPASTSASTLGTFLFLLPSAFFLCTSLILSDGWKWNSSWICRKSAVQLCSRCNRGRIFRKWVQPVNVNNPPTLHSSFWHTWLSPHHAFICVMSSNWGPSTLLCLGSFVQFVQKWSSNSLEIHKAQFFPRWPQNNAACLGSGVEYVTLSFYTVASLSACCFDVTRSLYSHGVDDKRQNQPVPCGMSRPHPRHREPEAVEKKTKNKNSPD